MRQTQRLAAATAAVLGSAVASLLLVTGPAASAAIESGGVLHPPVVRSTTNASTSTNWAGYDALTVSRHVAFHSITASWVVPTATRHAADGTEVGSQWVGIGGGCGPCTSNTIVQAGTDETVSGSSVSYGAWFELFPAVSRPISLRVRAGDHFSVSIGETTIGSGNWKIVLRNLTTGASFTTTNHLANSAYNTAEWIVETPCHLSGSACIDFPLPKLAKTVFSQATVNGGSAALKASEKILLRRNTNIATPSNPKAGGSSFAVCAFSTTCS